MQTGVYRQRRPERSALYKLMEAHYDAFREEYNVVYGEQYGFFRPEIDREIANYRKCGIPKYGFARVQCKDDGCGHEFILPFSCKSRCACPSCMQKHMLETGAFITEAIALEVPHRHIVFTIPKLMRKNFYWHRPALNDLSRMAWGCILAFMCNTLQHDGRPGAVLSIETAGEYQDANPHIHAITTDGVFTSSGSFYFMPRYGDLAEKYLRSLWEMAVTNYVREKGFVTEETISKVYSFKYTGFSVYARRRVEYKKSDERSVTEFEQLARYIVKPHFSLESMEYVPQTGKVLYHGTMNMGKRRNFEIFTANDFLAAVTSHIPKYRQRYLNYYGVYSSRARAKEKEYEEMPREGASVEQCEYRKRWAMLIRKVYEVDPLECPKCGKEMQIVEYVREAYAFLYKQWLISIDAWHEEPKRAPPEQPALELTYEIISDESGLVSEFADA